MLRRRKVLTEIDLHQIKCLWKAIFLKDSILLADCQEERPDRLFLVQTLLIKHFYDQNGRTFYICN